MKPCASQSLPLFTLSSLGASCTVWTPASLPLLRSEGVSGLSFSAESNASAPAGAEGAHPQRDLLTASGYHPEGSGEWKQARHRPAKPGGLALSLLARMELVADPARAMAEAAAATGMRNAVKAGAATHLQGHQLRRLHHSYHQAGKGEDEAAKSLEASEMILLSRTPIHHFLDRTATSSQLPSRALGERNTQRGSDEEPSAAVKDHDGDGDNGDDDDGDDDREGGKVDGSGCSTSASQRLKAMAWAKTVRGAVKVVEGNQWEDEEAVGEIEHLKRRRKRLERLEAAMAASAKRAAARRAVAGGAVLDSRAEPASSYHQSSLDPTSLARIELLPADLIRGRAKTCQGRLSHSLPQTFPQADSGHPIFPSHWRSSGIF